MQIGILLVEYHEALHMAAIKFAISVPAEVMKKVDRAAKKREITRSRFISDVLRTIADAGNDQEIVERINRLFSDQKLAREQRRAAQDFSRAASNEGMEW
jgi:metal-responsive CopG/Arc/MetJ family transcriptional regulator